MYTPTVQLFGHASGNDAQILASLSPLQSEEPEALLTRLRSGAITLSARLSSGTATQLCTLRIPETEVDGHVEEFYVGGRSAGYTSRSHPVGGGK